MSGYKVHTDWSSIVFNIDFQRRLEHLVQEKFTLDTSHGEEAVTFVIESLSANDWKKCKSFQGKSSPETFVYSLSRNLIIDFVRKVSGRPRPPTWLQKKGALWVTLWHEHCLQRASISLLLKRHGEDTNRDTDAIHAIIRAIKAKLPWCGVSTAPISIDEESGGQILDNHDKQCAANQADIYEQAKQTEALEFAHLLLGNAEGEKAVTSSPLLLPMLQKVELTAEEKLVLKMHFCDAISFSAIAKSLGMPRHHPVRLIESVLSRLRKLFDDNGI